MSLKTALITAAISASRTRGSYFKDKFYRLRARCGAMKAAMAIAHKILVAVYHILTASVPFRELGDGYLDARSRHRVTKSLVRRLDVLGYHVMLEPKVAATAVG